MATTTRVTAIFAIVAAVLVMTFYSVSAAEAPAEAPAPAPATVTDPCFDSLVNMSDCLTYVENGSVTTKPDKGCCPELAGVVESNPVCLCKLTGNTNQTIVGVTVDQKRALKLPSVCGITTPDPALCSVVAGGPLAPGPQPPSAVTPSSGSSSNTSGNSNSNGGSRIAGSALALIFGLAIAFHPTFF